MIDLDQVIDQSYREASDVEASSRRLEARIEQIPGTKVLLPSRKYGTLELQEIPENLTLASLISRSDAAPADYCGLKALVKHRIDKQREVQKMWAEAPGFRQGSWQLETSRPRL